MKNYDSAKEAFSLAIMLNHDILKYMQTDNELIDFRLTNEYKELLK